MISRTLRQLANGTGRVLRGERGAIFVTALLIVAVLIVLAVSASTLAIGESRATPYWRDRNGAFYAAESGLNHTLWKLKNAGGTCVPEGTYPADPPTFTSESEPESRGTLREGTWYEVWVKKDEVDLSVRHVSVLGHVGDQSYLLNATLDQQDAEPFASSDGDGWIDADEEGPAIVGPDIPSLGPLVVPTKTTVTIGPGEVMYDYIVLHEGATLKIADDTVLWVRQFIFVHESGVVNPPEDENQLVIYIPPDTAVTQNITLHNKAVLNAFVYAPNSDLLVYNKSTTYGLMVTDSISTFGRWTDEYDQTDPGIPWPATATVDYFIQSYGN